jgi:flagellar hook protein FlgE
MSLFNSLNTSTSGVIAASRATNVTSQNVANINTIGYKRSETSFQDIVANSLFSTKSFNSGGVGTEKLLRATQQGQIQQTSGKTDAAIIGNGFYVVSETTDGLDEFVFTRNGQFDSFAVRATEDTGAFTTEDTGEQTFLRNSAGFYLYGWPIDADGIVASGTDTTSLVAIDIGLFETQALPTTTVDLSINLDAAEPDYNPYLLSPAQTLSVSNQDVHFTRTVNVYDTLGTERPITFEFRKITGPMAQFTSDKPNAFAFDDVLVDDPTGPTPGITAGDSMVITNGNGTLTIDFVAAPADTSLNQVTTVADLRTVINNYTAGTPAVRQFEARISDTGQLLVQSALPSETLDISASSASVLGSTGFNIVTDPVDADYIFAPLYDINAAAAASYTTQGDFPAFNNTATPNTQGWWEATVLINDPSNPTGTTKVISRQGLLNFNGDGSLNALADATGNIAIDMSTVPIDFDLAQTGEELPFGVNIGNFTQFSSAYNVIQADQNGAGLGERTGIIINDGGIVSAEFSNGAIIDIYQIPLAMFNNANGLIERSGTVFALSENAGDLSLEIPTQGGAGQINGYALESSNVDLSNEFSNLIVHQRSFGLNSRVISVVDEMTQTLSRLKQ